MRYDLTDLRLFIAIAEARNLTRGAASVHLAPSSASHRLRLLEEELGTPLFERRARGLTLTRAGETLLRNARLKRNPQLSVSLEEHTSPEISLAVSRGEVEVGVLAEADSAAEVELIPYHRDRLVFVVPGGHALAARARVRFSEVLDYPFVMLHAGSAIHTFTMNAAAALGRHLDVRIQVRSFGAVCRMVGAGVGIGLVPRSAVPAAALPEPPVVVELDETWAQRDLQICVKQQTKLSGFAAALVDSLKSKADADL